MSSITASKRPFKIIPTIALTLLIGTSFYLEFTSAASLSRRTRSRTIHTTDTRGLQTTPSKGGKGTKAPSYVPPGTKSPSYVPKPKCKELQLKKLKPSPDPKDTPPPPPPGRYLTETAEEEFAQAAYQHFQQAYYPSTANAPSDPVLPPKDPLAPAPVPPKKTDQPTVEGGYVWAWVPVECPAPSASPSKSPQPSKAPSKSPTKSPTVSPAPSLSPKCREEGGIQTDDSINIKYQYEMVSKGSSDTGALDKMITAFLKYSLIDCGQDGYGGDFISGRKLFSNGRKLSVAGIDTSGTDVITPQACTTLSSSPGNTCNVINGEMTVYMDEETNQGEDAVPKTVSAQTALQIIKYNMENGSFVSNDILELSYKAGCIEGLTDCSFAIIPPKPGGNSALSSDNSSTAALSATGISVIVVASVLGVLIVGVITKRRTRTHNRVVEELIEEEADEDLFGKRLPEIDEERTDITSMYSSPWGERGARVVGDDDSVFDFDSPTSGRLYGLQASNSYGSSGHDVHKCTSATCYICKGQNRAPTFVDSDVVEQMEKRSYSYSNTVEI